MIGVVRMAMWVVLLAVDSELLTNNDTMIQGGWGGCDVGALEHGIQKPRSLGRGEEAVTQRLHQPYVHPMYVDLGPAVDAMLNRRVHVQHADV